MKKESSYKIAAFGLIGCLLCIIYLMIACEKNYDLVAEKICVEQIKSIENE